MAIAKHETGGSRSPVTRESHAGAKGDALPFDFVVYERVSVAASLGRPPKLRSWPCGCRQSLFMHPGNAAMGCGDRGGQGGMVSEEGGVGRGSPNHDVS